MSPRPKIAHKPLLIIISLLVIITASMFGVTLSSYVKELKLFGDGWIGPKYFAFDVESSGEHQKLAPGETAEYNFNVRNFDDKGVAQVELHVSIEIKYPQQLAGTGSIEAQLYRGATLLTSDAGSGLLAVMGENLPANVKTTDNYTLKLTWHDSDLDYLGEVQSEEFDASAVSISVSGYQ